jgi:hypothetical protein
VVDASKAAGITAGKTTYSLLLAINGTTATLTVNGNTSVSVTFVARTIQGTPVGLNYGIDGLATNNATASYGDTAVQVVVDPMTARYADSLFSKPKYFDAPAAGTWSTTSQGYTGTAPANGVAIANIDLGLELGKPAGTFQLQDSSTLDVTVTLKQTWPRAGLVYDMHGTGSFNFAALYADTQQVVLGHYTTAHGWVIDASVNLGINGATFNTIELVASGGTVNLSVNGKLALTFTYGTVVTGGTFGLLTMNGSASFQSLVVQTNDPAFSLASSGTPTILQVAAGAAPTGSDGIPLTNAQLAPIVAEAKQLWEAALGPNDAHLAALTSITVDVGNLMGLAIGVTQGDAITIDSTAAGWGWFVDPTPADNSEFQVPLSNVALLAPSSSPAFGHMDLLSTVLHEMGNVMGFSEDLGQDVTGMVLLPGERRLPGTFDPAATITPATSTSDAGSNPTPVIRWAGASGHSAKSDQSVDDDATSKWITDFLTNLGQDDINQKLNAGIRVRVPGGAAIGRM